MTEGRGQQRRARPRPMRATGSFLLFACAVLVACGGTTSPGASSTPTSTEPAVTLVFEVVITVHAGPTCPVERPGEPCPDAPVDGRVSFSANGEQVASGQTDIRGRYRVRLPSGMYRVTVDTGAPLPRCEPQSVEVVDRNLDVDIACDSGIR